MRTSPSVVTALTALLLGTLTPAALAGPLAPPAGPITSTFKPLSEVEPRIAISSVNTPGDADALYKITQPGSYYLTGNLQGVAGKHGIEIAAPDVTIDLMGFALLGVPGTLDGITNTLVGTRNLAIRNGSIHFWGGDGIDLTTSTSVNNDLRELHVLDAIGTGIRGGQNAIITACEANACDLDGITGDIGSAFVNCSATQNLRDGFASGFACAFTGCSSVANNRHGFNVANECALTGCTAVSCLGSGFTSLWGCVYSACAANNNTLNGFTVLDDSVLNTCIARENDGNGIHAAATNVRIVDSQGTRNIGNGIVLGVRGSVSGCVCSSNGGSGIRADTHNVLLNNLCSEDGYGAFDGAGIHVTGSFNRIEGNQCAGSDRGIDVDAANNTLFRNTCSANGTNWSIVANNVFGPIIDRTAPASAAVNGNAAASSAGTTDPLANFSH